MVRNLNRKNNICDNSVYISVTILCCITYNNVRIYKNISHRSREQEFQKCSEIFIDSPTLTCV